jgi:hypothetical protein
VGLVRCAGGEGGEATGEGVKEEFCDDESLLLFSAKRGKRPMGTAGR